MIWRASEYGPVCSVVGMGDFCVEHCDWLSPPWSAYFFHDGHERDLGQFAAEAEAKAECLHTCLKWETALSSARFAGCQPQDDGE